MNTEQRYGKHWGESTVLGDTGENILDFVRVGEWGIVARTLGFSEACPVTERLIDSRGPETMARRYAEVIYWRGHFQRTLDKHGRSDWADQLTDRVERLPDEPVGDKYDKDWVPDEHHEYMYGAVSPLGYALPRVMTQFIDAEGGNKNNRIDLALKVFNKLTKRASNLTELVVTFTDVLSSVDGDAIPYLKQLIGIGKLEEDNCYTEYEKIISVIYTHTKFLDIEHEKLTESELEELRIYNQPD